MAFTYDELNTASRAYEKGPVVQQVYQESHFFAYMAKNKKVKYPGGINWKFPIRYQKLDRTERTGFAGTVEFGAEETRTAAVSELKVYQTNTMLRLDEQIYNAGPGKIIDIAKDKAMELGEDLQDALYTDLLSATQVTNGIDALSVIVDSTASYGGIAVSDAAQWKAGVEDSSSTQLPLRSGNGTSLSGYIADCTFNGKKPTHIYTTDDIWETIEAAATANREYVGTKAELGFDYIMFRGAKVLADKFMPANYLYILNLDSFEMFCWEQGKMGIDFTDWMDLTSQGNYKTLAKMAVWIGNVKCNCRRLNGKCSALSGGIVG